MVPSGSRCGYSRERSWVRSPNQQKGFTGHRKDIKKRDHQRAEKEKEERKEAKGFRYVNA
jgi:hypothetical protein